MIINDPSPCRLYRLCRLTSRGIFHLSPSPPADDQVTRYTTQILQSINLRSISNTTLLHSWILSNIRGINHIKLKPEKLKECFCLQFDFQYKNLSLNTCLLINIFQVLNFGIPFQNLFFRKI